MKTVKEKAYAKVNICLYVKEKQNGYHALESVVSTVNLFDDVVLSSRKDNKITVKTDCECFIPEKENNAYKAAALFCETFSTSGADITIKKRIPLGSGLGGSSADIAATLNGMKKLYDIDEDVKPLADKLGSDSGYLLKTGFALMRGRGEIVNRFKCSHVYYFVAVFCGTISTAECFKEFDDSSSLMSFGDAENCREGLIENNFEKIRANCFNSLTIPAIKLQPQIKKALDAVNALMPEFVFMSGSGSTVLGCFSSLELCCWAKNILSRNFDEVCLLETI